MFSELQLEALVPRELFQWNASQTSPNDPRSNLFFSMYLTTNKGKLFTKTKFKIKNKKGSIMLTCKRRIVRLCIYVKPGLK